MTRKPAALLWIFSMGLQMASTGILRAEQVATGYSESPAPAAENPGYQRQLQYHELPEVTLVDQFGQQVDLRQILSDERPVMVNFIFTSCPTICPILTSSFARVQKQLSASDLQVPRMISISIDPGFDTPDILLDYSRRYKAGSDWYFLTGRPEAILKVQQAFDAYRGEKMNHVPVVFIRGSARTPWVRLTGYPTVAELLSEYQDLVSP
ncbi:SCO family protein [Thiolapillus sp.]